MALIWAANVKGLKPAAKIVLIQLADFHNKETGQCNPSAQRLADECEMGRATLFRHMTTLEDFGFVTRHARGDGDGGRGSNQYELHLDITLGRTRWNLTLLVISNLCAKVLTVPRPDRSSFLSSTIRSTRA